MSNPPPERGRPSLFTRARGRKVIKAIKEGLTFKQAASYAGVSYSTLNRWRKEGRDVYEGLQGDPKTGILEFWMQLEQAQGEASMRLLGVINKAAKQGDWKAATWILERRFSREWGPRGQQDLDPEEIDFPT